MDQEKPKRGAYVTLMLSVLLLFKNTFLIFTKRLSTVW